MDSCFLGALAFAGMIMVEFTDVGVTTISKAAMSRGMSSYVFVVYSNAFATLILLPFFIFYRKKGAPFTFSLLCQLFLLGLIGSSSLIMSFVGIKYSSPTMSSAMGNLIPIYTFLLAIIFGMEKLSIRKSSSKAKLVGTVVSVAGAFVVVLYEGPEILRLSSSSSKTFYQHPVFLQSNWVFGAILLAMACFLAAVWNIVQASIVHKCPQKVTLVFFYTFFVTVQCTVFSLTKERSLNSWVLRPDIEMVAIACSAILGSIFRIGVHTWCLQEKGPIFVAMFRPLGIAIAVATVVIFLGDSLYLGSVIGSILIAIGFYAVMWGNMKEESMVQEIKFHSLESSTRQMPLLG
ncbi:hypothetical protein UlMin_014955 [Ulmus minor]